MSSFAFGTPFEQMRGRANAKKIKFGSTIHAPFEQLEARNMALRWSIPYTTFDVIEVA